MFLCHSFNSFMLLPFAFAFVLGVTLVRVYL